MGSCVSTTRRRRRSSRKLSATATRFRRKVSAAIAGDAAGRFAARHGVVHVDGAPPASGVTLHLTQLQWQHSQMDAGNVICDEAWYDSVSMLGDTAGSDDDDNDYSSVSGEILSRKTSPAARARRRARTRRAWRTPCTGSGASRTRRRARATPRRKARTPALLLLLVMPLPVA
uniref:Uncharacterized protein n=1 Tax=Aegilops tauschii subsp. strangulata TaxID=200361 RepID=A0A453LVA6_AEGTS